MYTLLNSERENIFHYIFISATQIMILIIFVSSLVYIRVIIRHLRSFPITHPGIFPHSLESGVSGRHTCKTVLQKDHLDLC